MRNYSPEQSFKRGHRQKRSVTVTINDYEIVKLSKPQIITAENDEVRMVMKTTLVRGRHSYCLPTYDASCTDYSNKSMLNRNNKRLKIVLLSDKIRPVKQPYKVF